MEYHRNLFRYIFLFWKNESFKKSTLLVLVLGFLLSIGSAFAQTASTTKYTYDALGRVRMVQENGSVTESYQYDRAGNRCKVVSGVISETGYCSDGIVINEQYTSSWYHSSSISGSSYNDSDGTFTLFWGDAPSFLSPTEFRLWYQPPTGPYTFTTIGLAYSKAFTGLAPGLHDFAVEACGVESYDANEYEVIACGWWMRVRVTVQ